MVWLIQQGLACCQEDGKTMPHQFTTCALKRSVYITIAKLVNLNVILPLIIRVMLFSWNVNITRSYINKYITVRQIRVCENKVYVSKLVGSWYFFSSGDRGYHSSCGWSNLVAGHCRYSDFSNSLMSTWRFASRKHRFYGLQRSTSSHNMQPVPGQLLCQYPRALSHILLAVKHDRTSSVLDLCPGPTSCLGLLCKDKKWTTYSKIKQLMLFAFELEWRPRR